jgi:hypothetical protein
MTNKTSNKTAFKPLVFDDVQNGDDNDTPLPLIPAPGLAP